MIVDLKPSAPLITFHHEPPQKRYINGMLLSSQNIHHIGPLPLRHNSHHRPSKDILFLRAQEQATRHNLLPWWCPTRVLQMAVCRCHCGDDRFLESFRVRGLLALFRYPRLKSMLYRDFFPVILTFLRQLPVIGSLLSLPYIRTVRYLLPICCHRRHTVLTVF